MSLKVKDGKIRQDIVWSGSSTTAFIIGDHVYRYSLQYKQWLMFDYTPELSGKQTTYGVHSEQELLNLTPESVVCVKYDVSEEDFVFPMEEAIDFDEAASTINI